MLPAAVVPRAQPSSSLAYLLRRSGSGPDVHFSSAVHEAAQELGKRCCLSHHSRVLSARYARIRVPRASTMARSGNKKARRTGSGRIEGLMKIDAAAAAQARGNMKECADGHGSSSGRRAAGRGRGGGGPPGRRSVRGCLRGDPAGDPAATRRQAAARPACFERRQQRRHLPADHAAPDRPEDRGRSGRGRGVRAPSGAARHAADRAAALLPGRARLLLRLGAHRTGPAGGRRGAGDRHDAVHDQGRGRVHRPDVRRNGRGLHPRTGALAAEPERGPGGPDP